MKKESTINVPSTNGLSITMANGDQSNYLVTVSVSSSDKLAMRDKILLEYQKEVTKPGFRKGHVPLAMVEKMLNPGSLMMSCLEEFIHDAVNQVVADNKDQQRIGQPYKLSMEQYGDEQSDGSFSFTLDVYPTLHEKDTKWKKIKKDPYTNEMTQEDVDLTLTQLRSSYAQFEDADIVEEDVLTRVKIVYKNNDIVLWNSKNRYLGREDLEVNKDLKKVLLGKKTGDVVTVNYEKVSALTGVAFTAEGEQPTEITMEIIDTKKKVLPVVDQEFIDKIFTKEDNITTVEILMDKIKETLAANKGKNSLFERVNAYLSEIDGSFELVVPQTLVDEEMKNRLDHLSQQLGGNKGLQDYLAKMGEEKSKAYLEDIKTAGLTSMRNFFIIKFITEALVIDIDWTKSHEDGEVEQKLYDELVK